jgi:hypothetical protein
VYNADNIKIWGDNYSFAPLFAVTRFDALFSAFDIAVVFLYGFMDFCAFLGIVACVARIFAGRCCCGALSFSLKVCAIRSPPLLCAAAGPPPMRSACYRALRCGVAVPLTVSILTAFYIDIIYIICIM